MCVHVRSEERTNELSKRKLSELQWRGCAEQVEQGVTCEYKNRGAAALNKWSKA